MSDLLGLYVKLLSRTFAESRWLHWLLGVSLMVVVAGLVAVLGRGGDVLRPFGILGFDLPYSVALSVLFLFLTFVCVSVVGVPLFRYGGLWLVLLGIGVFAFQIYGYMRHDEWQSFALRDFTDVAFLTVALDETTGWVKGILREFLAQTPLSLFLIACGVVWHVGAKKAFNYELQDLKAGERQRLKPPDEARARPKLAASPGRWIPRRLYRRSTANSIQPPSAVPLFGDAQRGRPQATKVQPH